MQWCGRVDADAIADCADTDDDNDGVLDSLDNCPLNANPDQSNLDNQDGGDVCDACPNDATDTCDQTKSGGDTVDPVGGTISTPDGSIVIDIPSGAVDSATSISITDSGNGTAYELTTNLGRGTALFGVNLQPEGVIFNVPVTITFTWPDADNNGIIDGTNIRESVVRITKNNMVMTDMCQNEPGPLSDTTSECSAINNYFRIRTTSFSDWSLWSVQSANLANISTRGPVQTGDSVMIGGFIISGTAPRSVLIRGFGPTLADWGVAGAMSNPYIELYSGQTMIATNDDWQTPITQCDAPAVSCGTPQDIQATGKDACSVAITGCSQDAAILVTLPTGAYTAIVRGVGGVTGVGLVSIDEISQ